MENTLILIAVFQVVQLILIGLFHILLNWNSKVKRRVTLEDIRMDSPPPPTDFGTSTFTTKASDIEANQTEPPDFDEWLEDPINDIYRRAYNKSPKEDQMLMQNLWQCGGYVAKQYYKGNQPKSHFQAVEDVKQWVNKTWFNSNDKSIAGDRRVFTFGAIELFKAMQSENVKDVSDHTKGKKGREKK